MVKQNAPMIALNRGIIDKSLLARVDLERVRLSAEVMTNWLPKKQGPMLFRPGTKHRGSTRADTGARLIPFIASTDDVAILELTRGKMRVWYTDTGDTGAFVPVSQDTGVDTSFVYDTGDAQADDTGGWTDASVGGGSKSGSAVDQIPQMTAATTDGVTMSASSTGSSNYPWKAADDSVDTLWASSNASNPQWVKVDFGSGSSKTVETFTLTAHSTPNRTPSHFRVQASATGGNGDTGEWNTIIRVGSGTTYSDDTGQHDYANQTGWASREKRTFTTQNNALANQGAGFQYWRIYIDETESTGVVNRFREMELIPTATANTGQVTINSSTSVTLNSGAIGSNAIARKSVVVSDTGKEHSLFVSVSRGPLKIRIGTTSGDDDIYSERSLRTGKHNIKFTPESDYFWIDLLNDKNVDKTVLG
jgi:hypothetical protein